MVKAFHEDGVEERNKASKPKQDQCEMWTKLQALSWARSLVWHKVYSGINEHFHLYSLTILWKKKKRKKFLLSFFLCFYFILFLSFLQSWQDKRITSIYRHEQFGNMGPLLKDLPTDVIRSKGSCVTQHIDHSFIGLLRGCYCILWEYIPSLSQRMEAHPLWEGGSIQ